MLATSAIINVANQTNMLSPPVLATTSTSSPEINTTLKYIIIIIIFTIGYLLLKIYKIYLPRNSEEIHDNNFRQNVRGFHNSKDISQTSTSSSSATSHPPVVLQVKDRTLLQKPIPTEHSNCPQSPLSKMKVHKNSSCSNGNNLISK